MKGTKGSTMDGRGATARLSEHGLHGGVVQPELAGDGADGPLLAMVEAQDLRPTCSGVNTRILRVP
ncbi:hypothetical protein BE20_06335 [Sorangium cellulosum]|nr:hypothetical protein BE20_06335 [Sorangium cellulosum]